MQRLATADCAAITGIYHVLKCDSNGDGRVKPVPIVCRKSPKGYRPVLEGRGIEPVDVCGAGCLMLSRWLLERLPAPHFREPRPDEKGGEDFIFCEELKCRKLQLYAHFGVVCLHRKEVEI